jgi:putative transposase
MTISNELLDELLRGCKRPEDLLGDSGLMKELKVRLMERMLVAELTAHLGYEAGAEPPPEQTNRRNGVTTKRVKGSDGEVPLSVPRDREGSFEPVLVKKGQTRIDGVDDKSEPASRHRFETAGERALCRRSVGARYSGPS